MHVEWWSILPFVALLLCIAILPLIPATERAWEDNRVKLVIALVLGVPIAIWFIAAGAGHEVIDALVEYMQFIMLLGSLFVASGGIFLSGDIRATPRNNTIFLGVGAVLASFIGTTGAAMLLIRPILNTNKERSHRAHTVIFTIFVVANSGGLLTPLGDPPLFLGMLRGVPFEWTMGLWPYWLFVNALLLLTYYGLDRRSYATEPAERIAEDNAARTKLGLHGASGLIFLLVIILSVAFLPSVDVDAISEGTGTALDWIPIREIVMALAGAGAYFLGDRVARFESNKFTWSPILEVAALFIGIFLAMMPALDYLRQIADSLPLNEITLFIFTGGLSSVLDNAPTYATFFEMASQMDGAPLVAGVPEPLLIAVSLGAVLGGAITYIGNGPNFMVKSVAEDASVPMPSFGGYMRWSFLELVPVLAALALVFLTHDALWIGIGLVLTALLVARATWSIIRGARAHHEKMATLTDD